MQVKAKRTHFKGGTLRQEGQVFGYIGTLHKHIEPMKPKGQQAPKAAPTNPKAPTATTTPEETAPDGNEETGAAD